MSGFALTRQAVSILKKINCPASAAATFKSRSQTKCLSSALSTSVGEADPGDLGAESLLVKYPPRSTATPREAWVESLLDNNNSTQNLLVLHPDVWGIRPRLDIMWQNVDWQKRYRTVRYNDVKDRYDLHEGPRPWPQKGTGRARHRSKASPIWIQGGKAHGPRGPRTDFYMPHFHIRVAGLVHTLSAKFAQDDVRFVHDLEIPTDDPKFVEELIDNRGWGLSTLFVDTNDMFPKNITAATETLFHVNLMPAYGLNVHSMLKHKTLVMTVDALKYVEEKLLFANNRIDQLEKITLSSTSGGQ